MQEEFLIGVDDEGHLQYIDNPALDFLGKLGAKVTQRASHVEPDGLISRALFSLLRRAFGDKGRVGQWTRTWNVLWRVNLGPSNGPILDERFINRDEAIAAEIKWLETNIF
jgi:hypothetical protein